MSSSRSAGLSYDEMVAKIAAAKVKVRATGYSLNSPCIEVDREGRVWHVHNRWVDGVQTTVRTEVLD